MMSAIFQSTQKASLLGLGPHFIIDDINYQINFSVYVANGGPYYARLIKIHIHLIAFDQIAYREIQLIALMLMTSSKAHAPELRMVTRAAIEMIKLHSNREQTLNTGELLSFFSSGAYSFKAIKSSGNLKRDLNRAKVGHSSDVIFVHLAKLFNKNSKLWSSIDPVCMS